MRQRECRQLFFLTDAAPTELYTLSLHDALPICRQALAGAGRSSVPPPPAGAGDPPRSEEHTSELQSLTNLVCRLLLEKKNLAASRWTSPTTVIPKHRAPTIASACCAPTRTLAAA